MVGEVVAVGAVVLVFEAGADFEHVGAGGVGLGRVARKIDGELEALAGVAQLGAPVHGGATRAGACGAACRSASSVCRRSCCQWCRLSRPVNGRLLLKGETVA